MGRPSSDQSQQNETTASHFSHPHPLNLLSHQAIPNPSPNHSCSACKLKLSGMIYSCAACKFFLHKSCFEMPNKITHPFHNGHAFDLLPTPAYAGGAFNCDACSEAGDGFSYHCKPCGIDLHILCAAAPLSLTSAFHSHKLELAFGSPYDTKNFECDICRGRGLNHWLYRCNTCGFDAHLKCARASPPPPPPPAPAPAPVSGTAIGVPGVILQNEVALQAIMQMIQNNNAMVQAMMAGGGGGVGGGGGGRELQQTMQLISVLNRSGLGGGGLDSLLGGGGLDSLLGVGGLDFLGGGGLDFLGGLGGLL